MKDDKFNQASEVRSNILKLREDLRKMEKHDSNGEICPIEIKAGVYDIVKLNESVSKVVYEIITNDLKVRISELEKQFESI